MMKIILVIAFIGLAAGQLRPRQQQYSYKPSPQQQNVYRPSSQQQSAYRPNLQQQSIYTPSVSKPTVTRTTGNYKDIQIIRSEVENNGDGTYSYRYETSDGTIVEERGSLKPPLPGTDEPIHVAEGSYQYYSPEGELIQVTYRADENGFQPSGNHLPTPPPIPPEIQKSLDLIYKNVATQQTQSRQRY